MALAASVFLFSLYKATEFFWKKAFDAAWDPVDQSLKKRFARWAGTDQETQRRAAFAKAADIARTNTLRTAPAPQQAEMILNALDSGRDRHNAEALAEEAAKLMLFSATPDVPRLTKMCHRTLRFDALFAERSAPPAETVAAVLSDFLTNLREALLDQAPYHDLIQKDMRRTLNEILVELRPGPYDDEIVYRSQVAEVYRELEFVGIPELKDRHPITVEDVFIHLQAEQEAAVDGGQTEKGGSDYIGEPGRQEGESLPVPETRTDRSSRADKARVNVGEALRQTRRLVLLGDPGAGKTTLLKFLTIICAEGRAKAELGIEADRSMTLLPIFIPLREFAAECANRDHDYGLLDYLYTHAREHLLLTLPRGFFEEALEIGRCLVCLDGLDEVWAVGDRKAVTDGVKALAARFPRSRYVVASRIVGYDEAPLDRRDFAHHVILPLEDEEIRRFVHKWYHARERDPVQRRRKIADLIATIDREPRIRALARNPLLLTIIALVHRIEAELPHERVKLYDKCVTTLIDTWEEVKGLTISEKQRSFFRYRRRLLERLAFELHTRAEEPGRATTVREGDLERLLTGFLMENRRLGFADDPDGARQEVRAFIRLARGRTGLLIERGDRVFAFPHLTFQEYLTACEIEQRCFGRGADAVWDVIQHRLHDPHWREVILLLLGSLNKYEYDDPTTDLLERILASGERDAFEPLLHRHLYLAMRALADRVDVAVDLHQQIVNEALKVVRQAPEWERDDALTALSWLEQDSYAIDGLLALNRDEQHEEPVRIDTARVLGDLGCIEEAAETLLALAQDRRVADWLRRNAIQALGELGYAGETVVDGLLALAVDRHVKDGLRDDAALALGEIDGADEDVLSSLMDLARSNQTSNKVRRAAALALGRLGQIDQAVEVLQGLARDEGVADEVHRDVGRAMRELGYVEEATEILKALAQDNRVYDWVRLDAAKDIGELGHNEEAIDTLLALALDDRVTDRLRSDAVLTLAKLGPVGEAVLDGLRTLAQDSRVDEEVCSDAALALGKLGRTDQAAQILLTQAQDDQLADEVRGDVGQALGGLGCIKEAMKILFPLAQDERVGDKVRSDAARDLGKLGYTEEALDILLPLARGDRLDNWVRRPGDVTEYLLTLAQDDQVDDGVRSVAASVLGNLGCTDEAIKILMDIVCNPQVAHWIRSEAARALGKIGQPRQDVLEGLLTLVRDAQVRDEVRGAVAEALGQIGQGEDGIVDDLLALAWDDRAPDWVRREAAEALGELDSVKETALDSLLALAHDDQAPDMVHGAAAQALGKHGHTEEATDILHTLLQDSQVYSWVRRDAARALGKIGSVEQTVLDSLLTVARDDRTPDSVRGGVARALGELGCMEEALELLLVLLLDSRIASSVRRAAARAIGAFGSIEEQIWDGLWSVAQDSRVESWVRSGAGQALGMLGRTEEAVETLLALAEDSQRYDLVRREAARTLGELGQAHEAAQALATLAHDGYDSVRRGAYNGLKELVEGTVE